MSIFKKAADYLTAKKKQADEDKKREHIHQMFTEAYGSNDEVMKWTASQLREIGIEKEKALSAMEYMGGVRKSCDVDLTEGQSNALVDNIIKQLATSRELTNKLISEWDAILRQTGVNSQLLNQALDEDIKEYIAFLCSTLIIIDDRAISITNAATNDRNANRTAISATISSLGMNLDSRIDDEKCRTYERFTNTPSRALSTVRQLHLLNPTLPVGNLSCMIISIFITVSNAMEMAHGMKALLTNIFYVGVNNYLRNQMLIAEKIEALPNEFVSYLEIINQKMKM